MAEPRLGPDRRLALLMHGHLVGGYGKMGLGLIRYSPATIAAVIDRVHAGQTLSAVTGISRSAPIVPSVRDALALGADTLVIGVATPGGLLPSDYWQEIRYGVAAGLSLVNGLHQPLAHHPDLTPLLRPGAFIWDVRQEPPDLSPGAGAASALSARRVVTVGTDMAIGKMTASIELDREAASRGLRSRFLATGQIGICIAGEGVALDAVRVDFAAGAVEKIVMKHADNDLLFVEGQGSALHPASTAWLAILRGSCPTHLVLVHRAGQKTLSRHDSIPIPPLQDVAALYQAVSVAAGALRPAPVVGIALNCGGLNDDEAARAIELTAAETGLPTVDVVRQGAGRLLDAILNTPA